MTEEDVPRRSGTYHWPVDPQIAEPIDYESPVSTSDAEEPGPAEPFVPGHARTSRWASDDPRAVRILAVALALVLVVCGFLAARMYFGHDNKTRTMSNAKVGDCLKGTGIDGRTDGSKEVSLQVVNCRVGSAKYKVVGRFTNKPESEASTKSTLCNPYPDTQFIYWEGVPKEKGTILCLALNKK